MLLGSHIGLLIGYVKNLAYIYIIIIIIIIITPLVNAAFVIQVYLKCIIISIRMLKN